MAEHSEAGHSAADLVGGKLQCVVVTPEATALEAAADFVVLPLLDGEIGIAPGHSPMIGRLGLGEMRVVEGGHTRRFYLDGGFVQVAANTVSVLTNRAITAEKLDVHEVTQQLAAARAQIANSPETLANRERQQLQARAQLRVAQRVTGRSAATGGAGH